MDELLYEQRMLKFGLNDFPVLNTILMHAQSFYFKHTKTYGRKPSSEI